MMRPVSTMSVFLLMLLLPTVEDVKEAFLGC